LHYIHRKMVVRITPLGGVGEVGRNCIAVDIDGKIIICDMGFHLERYISVTGDDFPGRKHLLRRLLTAQAIPDRRWLMRRKKDIVGICISHAHLDHVGALPFLAKSLQCPIYATRFAGNIIRSLCQQHRVTPSLHIVNPGDTVSVSGIPVEFIRLAHSTPESCLLALHSPNDGIIMYANDYKNHTHPPFQPPSDVSRLQALKGKVSFLIVDSLYADTPGKCLSESQAREEVLALKEKLEDKRAIVLSTFSSHISRIRSLIDLTLSLGRTPIFVGRSLSKYLEAGEHIYPESKRYKQLKFRSDINRYLEKVGDPTKYVFIVTGHQGEPNAVLSRMADGIFDFKQGDVVVFSCKTIPTPITIDNRERLETQLKKQGVECITDVHVSGHAHQQDHRELFDWVRPTHVLPSHAEPSGVKACEEIIKEFDDISAVKLGLLESFSYGA
jgi:ribonuclease J